MTTSVWRASRATLRAAALIAAAFAATTAFAQNLLQNGSFESSYFNDSTSSAQGIGYVSPPPSTQGRATVPSWTWTADPTAGTGNNSSTFALNITGGNLGETAQDGSYSVSFGTGSYAGGGSIAQSFAVTSGAHCTLSFWVRRIGGGEGIGARVQVTDNNNSGAAVALVDSGGTSYASSYTVPIPSVANTWSRVVLKFTAPSSGLRFTFTDTTAPGTAGSTDLGLDDVSITQKTLQTLTILGGHGNQGEVAANTEFSPDGGTTWSPAYLSGGHPWGFIAGTNSWINQSSSPYVGLNATTLFRVRFDLPADFEQGQMSFQVNADNYGELKINSTVLSNTTGGPYVNDLKTADGSSLLPGQTNTLSIKLTDTGGLVGINYILTLTGYSASAPTVVAVAPVITSALTASGRVGVPFTYTLTGGNIPTSFGAGSLPPGLTIDTTTGIISGTPTTIGTYNTTVSETNAGGTATATLVITITKGSAAVTLGGLSQTYDGTIKAATATTSPGNLTVDFSYTGAALPPINAGSYGVLGTVNDANYTGSASGTLVIVPEAATVSITNLVQSYDGTAKSVTTATSPAGVPVTVTYNGSTTAPAAVGSYAVVASTNAANYSGSATATLQIKDTTPPVIAPLSNVTVEATSASGAIVTLAGSATDNVDGTDAVTFSPASGSTFALGTTTVTATSHDVAGNTSSSTFTVTVLDTTAPTLLGQTAFTDSFASYSGTSSGGQVQSGLQVFYNGTVAGWTNTGFHSAHAVDRNGSGDYAIMFYNDNVITLASGVAANVTGTKYAVAFTASPAVSGTLSQATAATDGLLIEVLRPDGSVLAQSSVQPGAWAGATVFSGYSFVYTGDGSGPVRLRISSLVPGDGRFGGAIDDVVIAEAAPADVTLEATSASGAVASFNSTAIDRVSSYTAVTASAVSGGTFPIGTTPVRLRSADAAGNVSTSVFNVIVTDTTPPVITGPGDLTAEATSATGAAVTFAATASDLVDGAVTVTATPASGSTFPLGATTVTLSATDAHGNTATKTFTVTVQDTTPPTITVPAPITAEATGATGAAVTFSTSASDLVDGAVAVTASPASGSTFALGTTTVTLTSADAHGNTATKSFTVTVRDTTPPVITAPAPIVAEATSGAGAAVSFTATATDLVDGATAVTATPASGSVFGLGTTTVTLTSSDKAGNVATKTFPITVRDTTPPALTVPANQTIEATSAAGAVATFAATATDAVTTSPAIAYSAASGSTFALGVNTVTVTATDAAGNRTSGSFTITVRDTTPPALVVPANLTLEATSAAGAVANFVATATDAVTASPTIAYSQAPGSTFPIGVTTVTVTATDAAGNRTTGTFTVTVRDTTPPTITSLTATPGYIWPPNKKMVPVTITAVTSDLVGVASVKIISVTTSQPDNRTQWTVTGNLTLNLLADRLGEVKAGRIYTITVEARDAAGNASQKTVTVIVPHDDDQIPGNGDDRKSDDASGDNKKSDHHESDSNGSRHD